MKVMVLRIPPKPVVIGEGDMPADRTDVEECEHAVAEARNEALLAWAAGPFSRYWIPCRMSVAVVDDVGSLTEKGLRRIRVQFTMEPLIRRIMNEQAELAAAGVLECALDQVRLDSPSLARRVDWWQSGRETPDGR